MAINLPTFPEFDLQPRETVHIRFEKYQKRLNTMFAAMGIEEALRKSHAIAIALRCVWHFRYSDRAGTRTGYQWQCLQI